MYCQKYSSLICNVLKHSACECTPIVFPQRHVKHDLSNLNISRKSQLTFISSQKNSYLHFQRLDKPVIKFLLIQGCFTYLVQTSSTAEQLLQCPAGIWSIVDKQPCCHLPDWCVGYSRPESEPHSVMRIQSKSGPGPPTKTNNEATTSHEIFTMEIALDF